MDKREMVNAKSRTSKKALRIALLVQAVAEHS